ncbi:MAG: HAMP domain-containing protein [Nitrospirae bacterium]|nr:HAMP domain-containing protein [Nitrospirota bacterium]
MIFFVGGLYIIVTIEKTTSRLDKLIVLHQVEILREHLLIQIKRVQADINLKNTRYARSIDTIMTDFRDMEHTANACFGCHHSDNVIGRLSDLKNNIEYYKNALSRILTIRANAERLAREEDNAFNLGEELIIKLNNMIAFASGRLETKTRSTLEDIHDTKVLLFILVAAGPILATGLALVFIKGFTHPISELLNATKIFKSGDLDHRIKGLTNEFGELAESINDMARSLKEHMIKMQRTEQMNMCGELAIGLAHEIKNPLAAIKISMEVFSTENTLPEEDRDVLLKVIGEIKRIEALLKDLLSFARPPKPQFNLVNVNTLLDASLSLSIKSLFSPDKSDTINIIKDFDSHLPETMADPMQLKQVFLNLLLNAIDAMPEGGTLTAKTSYDSSENTIKIEIADTGRGIEKAIIDKVFQPFFTTKAKGTGLGLAITKRLIEEQKGSISVDSIQGRGTTFKIALPVYQ